MLELAGDNRSALRVSVAVTTNNDWIIADSRGIDSAEAIGRRLDPKLMESVLATEVNKPVQLIHTLRIRQSGGCSLFVGYGATIFSWCNSWAR